MRISDVAEHTGVPTSTIHYYEKRAITLKPLRSGRDRVFSPADIRAIEFVRDAQSLGLTLREISDLLQNAWDTGDMAKTAAKHRAAIRNKIAALTRTNATLAILESCTCKSFAACDLTADTAKSDCCA